MLEPKKKTDWVILMKNKKAVVVLNHSLESDVKITGCFKKAIGLLAA